MDKGHFQVPRHANVPVVLLSKLVPDDGARPRGHCRALIEVKIKLILICQVLDTIQANTVCLLNGAK